MFNHALIKRLEDENVYLRKMVDNLLGRLGVEKVTPDPVEQQEPDQVDDGKMHFGG